LLRRELEALLREGLLRVALFRDVLPAVARRVVLLPLRVERREEVLGDRLERLDDPLRLEREEALDPLRVERREEAGVFVPLVLRRRAAVLACFESAFPDAALRPSFFRARLVAVLRRREGDLALRRPWPVATSRLAERRVRLEVVPSFGASSGTPARRALERPMAIACFVLRAPCLPSRMWSISS
jgi:hypothetical protein